MDHHARRARLRDRLAERDVDALLVTHLPNVRYLTGFGGSYGLTVVAAGSDGDGAFVTDGRYDEASSRQVAGLRRWISTDGPERPLAEACRALGVTRLGFEPSHVTVAMHGRLGEALGPEGVELVGVDGEVEHLRWTKDADEMALLAAAQEAADVAFERVLEMLAEGRTEREVAFDLEAAMRVAGAEGPGFDSIVAFGENAAEPHHGPTGRPLGRGDVVKLDFGCSVGGYVCDTTRTVAFGEPPGSLREIHEVVRRAQQAGIDAVAVGVAGGEPDRAARAVIEEAGYGERFVHSLGHGVGLEVHEGPYLRRGGTDVLPEGAVVTFEPGIYVPGLGGVRIEDMVEVTAAGARPMPRTTRELIVL